MNLEIRCRVLDMRFCHGLIITVGLHVARRVEVRGEITLDSDLIAKGTITFFPAEGNTGPATGGTIKGGHYHISRADGPFVRKKRIQIRAFRKTVQRVLSARNPDNIADELGR